MNYKQNRLLCSLSKANQKLLLPHLDHVELEYKLSLYVADEPIEYVYFITSGVGSLVNTMENGQAAEVGTVGNEGVIGLPILLGDKQSPMSMYVQVPGDGFRIKANIFLHALVESPDMWMAMLRYAHAFFNQVAQSAACAHFHPIEKRCCRWLLMTNDRMHSNEFLLTQEFLGMMLGVRRAGVNEVARLLQDKGLIDYHYGRVTILDHNGLANLSCECYGKSKREFDRLLGG